MVKVDFFGIGVQKAGTTLLHDILIQHPNIYLPKEKKVEQLLQKDLSSYKC